MAEDEKPDIPIEEATGSYIPIEEVTIPIEEATDSSQTMAIMELQNEIKEVRKENRNIIIGVVVAFILVVGTILVEIWIFHASNHPCH